jgi:hypothetical protein
VPEEASDATEEASAAPREQSVGARTCSLSPRTETALEWFRIVPTTSRRRPETLAGAVFRCSTQQARRPGPTPRPRALVWATSGHALGPGSVQLSEPLRRVSTNLRVQEPTGRATPPPTLTAPEAWETQPPPPPPSPRRPRIGVRLRNGSPSRRVATHVLVAEQEEHLGAGAGIGRVRRLHSTLTRTSTGEGRGSLPDRLTRELR